MSGPFDRLLAGELRRQSANLQRAGLLSAVVSSSSVLALGLSGWFVTGAALAGAAGPLAISAFNYMLPSAGIRLFAIARTGARYGERLASHKAALDALARVRPVIFHEIAAAPASRALAISSGEGCARAIDDVNAIELSIVSRSAGWGLVAAIVCGIAMALLAGWACALSCIGWIGLLLLLAHTQGKRRVEVGRRVQRATGALREEAATWAAAAAEVRCFFLEGAALNAIQARGLELGAARRAQAAVEAYVELGQAAFAGIAAVTALLLAVDRGAPIAALVALAAVMSVDGAAPFLRRAAQMGRLEEARLRLNAMLAQADAGRQEETEAELPPSPDISIDGLVLTAGERCAIVGPSGVGKSTLIESLIGLRDAAPGVTIGEKSLANMPPAALRRIFAWAPQNAMLISGTVRDNLQLAAPGACERELWSALEDAALADRVRALPQGLESWIGEDGCRLSGGERRRLSLARAYLSPTPWLLLDEPTEGLDPNTEARVIRNLDRRLQAQAQGAIIVTHRPAVLAICDANLELACEAGRIAQEAA